MQLPSWLRKQSRGSLAAPPITYEVADSFHTAPGWRDVGMEYSLIPDSSYPPDSQVTRAIHSFDPGVIHLWVRWIFMSPSNTGNPQIEVFGRHAVGRYVKNPHGQVEPFRIDVPANYHGPVPNLIERILMGEPDSRARDLPGIYVPWDWKLYYDLRNDYLLASVKDIKKLAVEDQAMAWLRYRASLLADRAYRNADIRAYAERKLANVSELEAKERFLGNRTNRGN